MSGEAFPKHEVGGSVAARFLRVAAAHADREALSRSGASRTYAALAAEAGRIARAILARRPGDEPEPVALLVSQAAEVPALLGALLAGKAYAVLDPAAPAPAQQEALRILGERTLLLADAPMRAAARALGREVLDLDAIAASGPPSSDAPAPVAVARGPGDLAAVVFTSGSTGARKGVMRSHRALLHRAWLLSTTHGVGPGDRVSRLCSCRFVAAEVDVLGALLTGATLCDYDLRARGHAPLAAWLADEGITHLHPPVAVMRRLLRGARRPLDAPRLRLVALGGDPLAPADLELCARLLPRATRLEHRLSSSEAGPIAALAIDPRHPPEGALVPVGRPVEDKVVHLLDAEGHPCRDGEPGEVVVESRYLALGYRGDPEGTAARFEVEATTGARRLRTGDLCVRSPQGLLTHVGRADQMVKIRGRRVGVAEVEAALLSLAGVAEAAVVVGQDALGEPRLEAFVAGLPREDAAGAREALRRRLPPEMVPARVTALLALPLTPSGKPDRRALLGALGPVVASSAGAGLAGIWCELLERPEVRPDDDFFALGGDSLLAAELCARVELRLGRRLLPPDIAAAPTLGALAALLEAPPRASGSRLVALTPTPAGDAAPLFCVHALGGDANGLLALARRLAPSRPVIALEARGLDGNEPPHASVEEIARAYVAEMRAARPRGPYLLLGRCFGGAIALEMARALERGGERVALLALVDISVVPATSRAGALARALRDGFARGERVAASAALDLLGLRPEGLPRRAAAALLGPLGGAARALGAGRAGERAEALAAALRGEPPAGPRVEVALRGARARHVVREPFLGRVLLVAPERRELTPADPALWHGVARGPLERVVVRGDHTSMLHEPHVAEVARLLEERIAAALAESDAAPPAREQRLEGAVALASGGARP